MRHRAEPFFVAARSLRPSRENANKAACAFFRSKAYVTYQNLYHGRKRWMSSTYQLILNRNIVYILTIDNRGDVY